MRIRHVPIPLALLLSWFAAGPALAGVVIEAEQREPGSQAVTARTIYYLDAGRLRVETKSEEGEDSVVIFRADKSVAWLIDRRERTYAELTPAKAEAMRAQVEHARRQMAEQLAQVPPEQRQAIEQMMGQRLGAPAPVSVRVLARGETVGSFVCTRYEVLRGEKRTAEVWAAPLAQLQVDVEEFKSFAALGRLFEELGPHAPETSLASAAGLEGFPVRSLRYEDGRVVTEERVLRAERQALDPALFELPPGLRETPLGPEE